VRCHSCGTEVHDGQKFCAECGASLRGVADVTGEVPVIATPLEAPTREMATVPPPPSTRSSEPLPRAPVAGTTGAVEVTAPVAAPLTMPTDTADLHVVEATSPPVDLTAPLPVVAPTTGQVPVEPARAVPARAFRLRPILILALVAAGATVVAVFGTIVRITPPPDGAVPRYTVNGLGTNNTVAALLAAGAMVVGALLWCFGRRWGAGLAGGAGASLAGWVALMIGLMEWRIDAAPDAVVDRSVGFWALWVAGSLGVVVLVASLAGAGRDRRAGLDPWIAALAAVSFMIAAVGPLIPRGTADWSGNWSTESLGGVDLPEVFFVGRAVQLGLLVLCGVIGCLLVRRWGLGFAVGGMLSAGWLLVTAATNRTTSPIGPAYANPGAGTDLSPHGVTVVGFALTGFFTLVAVVMALLDADR
jgi:hypothetical protein